MTADPSADKNVLVLDDDPQVAALLSAVARRAGATTTVVTDPNAMLSALTGHDGLVILDLAMGNLDGIEVMRSLKELAPHSEVLLVSGAGEAVLESARRIAAGFGVSVVGAYSKPVPMDVLRGVISGWSAAEAQQEPQSDGPAIDVDELFATGTMWLEYQPQYEVATAKLMGAEALLRVKAADGNRLSPIDVVCAAEAAGRSLDILRFVAQRAAQDRRQYPAIGDLHKVSINVSPQDLLDPSVPDYLIATLAEGAPLDRWTVELTETAPDNESGRSLTALTRLRLHGMGLAIDDFGSGAASFSRLFDIPFTELKIDRVVIGLLGTADEDVVRSTIALGHSRGIVVVAEGIEHQEELDRLKALGCDLVQGYLLGRPTPPDAFPPDNGADLQATQQPASA